MKPFTQILDLHPSATVSNVWKAEVYASPKNQMTLGWGNVASQRLHKPGDGGVAHLMSVHTALALTEFAGPERHARLHQPARGLLASGLSSFCKGAYLVIRGRKVRLASSS